MNYRDMPWAGATGKRHRWLRRESSVVLKSRCRRLAMQGIEMGFVLLSEPRSE
jgi:hypothetical protein